MSWMIGRNHCTVPTGRRNLGSSPNVYIRTEKTSINNFGMMGMDTGASIYSPMMMGGMMGMYNPMMMGGMGMYNPMMMGGMGLYGDCYGGGAGTTAATVGTIFNTLGALAGAIAQKKTDGAGGTEQPETNPETNPEASVETPGTRAAVQSEKVREVQQRKLESEKLELAKEGITVNSDGTYSTTVKDLNGKDIQIKSNSKEDIRAKKQEIQQEVDNERATAMANNISITSGGELSVEIETTVPAAEGSDAEPTTKTVTLTSSSLDALLNKMEEYDVEIKRPEENKDA